MVGRAMAEVSKVVIDVFRRRLAEPLLDSGGTNTDVVVRLAAMRDLLVPALAPLLEVALRRHLAAAIRSEISVATEQMLQPGEGHRTVSVAFADLVGFTAASESLPVAEVGRLASRLCAVAEPGEILLHLEGPDVAKDAWTAAGLAVTPREVGALKGITEEPTVLAVRRS